MFEAWQVGDAFREWCRLGRPLRFGQWFMNRYKIEGHSVLFNETNSEKAKAYILKEL